MNRPRLHLARPGQLPAPATGDDSLDILSQAIESLARVRTTYWLGDSAVHLHALASLIAQAEQILPRAVHDARDQELTWTQIGELLNRVCLANGVSGIWVSRFRRRGTGRRR
jgi:hypothetical protein